MDKKIKLGITPAEIISIVFGMMGAIYFAIGIASLTQYPSDLEDHEGGIAFSVLGGIFLIVSITLLICGIARRRRLQNIYSQGRYVLGEIADILPNYNVRINGRYTYLVAVRYVDRFGNIHSFRSGNQRKMPDRSIIGKPVKIYYENESFKHYYIDLEGVLPNVIEH